MTSEITLVEKIEEMELAPEQSKTLLDSFGDLFVEAHKLVAQAKGIKVTKEDQVLEMGQAKEIRIKLMKVRTQAEKTKKLIKEPYLRGAQAAQDIYNDIKEITEPEEERLYEQEKFAELAEQARVDKRLSDRVMALQKYVDDVSVYSLRDMPEDVFGRLVDDCKMVYEAKVEKIRKEEEERVEKAKAEAKRQEEIRKENAKLKKEAEERELIEKMRRDESEKKIKKAEEARETAERILREKEEAEEAKRVEAEKLEKEALLAPDKVKLIEFADRLDNYSLPSVQSPEALLVVREAEKLLIKASNYLREKSRNL